MLMTDALTVLLLVWVLWRTRKEKRNLMAAIDNLRTETDRLTKIASALVAAPKGVSESDVQAQADVVKAANDSLATLVPPIPTPAPGA